MTIKKAIKITASSFLGLGFLLFTVLIIHIVIMLKSRKPLENATIQMVRVDFKQPVDPVLLRTIETRVKASSGVKDVYFNPHSNILIYTFDATQNKSRDIYRAAIQNSGFKSEIHIVTKEEESKGCPAMDNHTFYGKMTSMVEWAIK